MSNKKRIADALESIAYELKTISSYCNRALEINNSIAETNEKAIEINKKATESGLKNLNLNIANTIISLAGTFRERTMDYLNAVQDGNFKEVQNIITELQMPHEPNDIAQVEVKPKKRGRKPKNEK